LKVTYIGYGPVTVSDVRVALNDTARVNIEMVAAAVQVQALEVIGARPDMQRAATSSMRVARAPRQFNTEEYDRTYENDFLDAALNPLSTFSIDVDVASYANTRRFLQNGTLPPPDAIRTEELVNYFSYEYPEPEKKEPFSMTTEYSAAPWEPSHGLIRIAIQGKHLALDKLPPCNLVFLIDVSGSMDEPNKLPLVQSAFRLLVHQLRPEDFVSIVVYASRAGLILPPTSGKEKTKILSAIDELEAAGSTAGGEGILLAYKTAESSFLPKGNNRIVWATDGDFNVGVSNTADLVRLVEEKREKGVFLSVLGFGMGNIKDSRLEQLADKGNGNYAYIDNFTEARRVLVGQMAGTLFTIAKDVKIQVEFNPVSVKAYRLIGYENRLLKSEDFSNDKKDAGELGAGHSVTAFYEIVPVGVSIELPHVDSLRYQVRTVSRESSRADELMLLKLRYKPPSDTTSVLRILPIHSRPLRFGQTTADFKFATAVVEFAMILRDSPFKGKASFDALIDRAQSSLGKDPEGYRSEFVRLARVAKDLTKDSKR
jgi:Ca-activated chloride channel family protein